jgi:hypothetical protein
MANVPSAPPTAAELAARKLINNSLPTEVRWDATITFDGTPGAVEVPLNGIPGDRLILPKDSAIYLELQLIAWNMTDGAGNEVIYKAHAAFSNDDGTVAVSPTNLSGSDGNPIEIYDVAPGSEAVALAADNTNDAVILNFTGEANKVYKVTATANIVFIAANTRFLNINALEG